ncbi:MAG: transposase [Chloroflexi bacterium]|nr:transposase [Chloroflexota bacterium]
MMTGTFLHMAGARRLAASLDGSERLYLGGATTMLSSVTDQMSVFAYPILLGDLLRQRGIEPRLTLTSAVADWASRPSATLPTPRASDEDDLAVRTLQFQNDELGCHATMADHAAVSLEDALGPIKEHFPGITTEVVRASTLRNEADFRAILRLALKRPHLVSEAIVDAFGEGEGSSVGPFAGPVCRKCHSIEGSMKYIEDWDRIQFQCASCSNGQEAEIREQDYWVDARILNVAIVAALRPSIFVVDGHTFAKGALTRFISNIAESAKVNGNVDGIAYLVTPP